ncbi:MAG: ABC transporter permease [Nanoarchaeota archaeon]|nr:ABC transporter permease [Nanoarchaeota archaeon]MBU1322256.1 ABC transporter permease [Nanoarchaeota archaeon]MBU1598236.1 ABC transporter permease [Nanoarchaeota archaeon]MBU2441989.1 ABC transporter permease [Nanoarchaeota archaeon]
MNKKLHTVKEVIISIIIFICAWYLLSIILKSYFLPRPEIVLKTLVVLLVKGEITIHLIASLKRTLLGFTLALLAGSLTAYMLGLSKSIGKYFHPMIEFIRPIPPLAWIPLAIVWFGIGNGSAIFVIFIATFFPIFTSTYFGVKTILNEHKRLKHHYQLNNIQYFTHIVFPHSLPYLLSGSKTGLGMSWMAVIAAEIIAANTGLGYFIEINRVLLNIEIVIATMIIIGIIGYTMALILKYIETKILYWVD